LVIRTLRKKENPMKNVQRLAVSKLLLATLSMSLIVVGIAPAQVGIPTFTGNFKLTTQVLWGKTVLPPDNYTITVESSSLPVIAFIRDGSGRPVAQFMSAVEDGKTSGGNALLIREKNGQLRVYGLALASLREVLLYDRALAREEILQARTAQTVPVMLAKR
jgi:hypothetical protein